MADEASTKICAKCHVEKSTDEFYKRGDSEKFRSRCKPCCIVDRSTGSERHAARSSAWRAANYERSKAACRSYYAKNIHERRAYSRAMNATTEGKAKSRAINQRLAPRRKMQARGKKRDRSSYLSEYAKANPDKWRAYHNKRRAAKRAASGTHTAADIQDIRKMQRDRCANSGCRVELHGAGAIDHIQALAKDGSNDRRNLQLLCKPCNSKKRDRDALEFMRDQGYLL